MILNCLLSDQEVPLLKTLQGLLSSPLTLTTSPNTKGPHSRSPHLAHSAPITLACLFFSNSPHSRLRAFALAVFSSRHVLTTNISTSLTLLLFQILAQIAHHLYDLFWTPCLLLEHPQLLLYFFNRTYRYLTCYVSYICSMCVINALLSSS